MKIKLYLLTGLISLAFLGKVSAQLPDGTIAPDWTLTDLNGNVHHLYDYLNAGKTVVIDFSATWCGPCWNYHNTGILETLWDDYGPDGTDEIMVFFLEGDIATNDACLYGSSGCSTSTQGNWVAGTGYPIINIPASQSSVVSNYQISYYPTLYVICADNKKTYEAGQTTVTGWENWIFGSCALSADYTSQEAYCYDNGSIDLSTIAGFGTLSYDWSNGQETQDLVNINPGIYSVTITDSHGHFIEVDDIEVDGLDAPFEVNLVEMIPNDCFGESYGSISVAASSGTPGYEYNWSNGDTGFSITDLAGGEYTVTITDVLNCETVESFNLEDPDELVLGIDLVDATCGENNGQLMLSAFGGTGDYYLYDIGSGFSYEDHYTGLEPGWYDVAVRDQNGCENYLSEYIAAGPATYADAGEDGLLDCENMVIELDASGSSDGPNYGYFWYTPDGNILYGATTMFPGVDAPGTYILQVYDEYDNCEAVDEVIVTSVIDYPAIEVAIPGQLSCMQPLLTIDASDSDNGPDLVFDWTTTDGHIVSGASSPNPVVDAPGTYTLTLLNLTTGCSSSENVIVSGDVSFPEFTAAGGEINCQQSTIDICVTPDDPATQIVWEDGTLGECLTVDAGGIYHFTATGANGCSVDSEVEVQEDSALPEFSTTAPDITCDQPQVDICVNPSDPTSQIVWADGTQGTCLTVGNGGVYTFTITGANGCSTQSEVEVIADASLPLALAGEDQVLTCTLTSVLLDASASSQGDVFTYQWTDEAGNVLGTESQLLVTLPGMYTFHVFNSENGCTGIDQVVVTEFINTPDPAFTHETLYNIVNVFSQSAGTEQESSWTSSDGQTAQGQEASFVFMQSGSYEICHSLTNECGTETSCEIINVQILPLAFDAGIIHVSCPGGSDGTISVSANGGVPDYSISWTGPDGYSSDQFSITDLPSGVYEMTLSDAAGNEITESFIVEAPQPFNVSTLVTDEIDGNGNGAIDVTVTGGTPPYSYSWSNNKTDEDLDNLVSGDYTLIITDANGCIFTVTVTVDSKTGIGSIPYLSVFEIYPNPASEKAVAKFLFSKKVEGQLQLVNGLGQILQSIQIDERSTEVSFELGDVQQGMYLLVLKTPDGTVCRRLVKQ